MIEPYRVSLCECMQHAKELDIPIEFWIHLSWIVHLSILFSCVQVLKDFDEICYTDPRTNDLDQTAFHLSWIVRLSILFSCVKPMIS